MIPKLKDILQEVSYLFYPNLCLICQEGIIQDSEIICTTCQADMPYTHFHKNPFDNILKTSLSLYYNFQYVLALLYFRKTGLTQKIIHALKYGGQEHLGKFFGNLYANRLIEDSNFWKSIDLITFVPLSKKKQQKRGYNQNELFAETLSQRLAIPLNKNILKRKDGQTQARQLLRFRRWENVANAYQACEGLDINGQHILLIDDVVTTGATLEACAKALEKQCTLKISILSLATTLNF